MPYKLSKRKDGYVVVNEETGEDKNKKPMPRSKAVAYMRALYAAESGAKMGKKGLVQRVLMAFKRQMDPDTGGGMDRDKLAGSDFVDPERRRFPIVTPGDVKDAVSSYGRAKPPIPFDEFKRRVIAICRRNGAAFMAQLPKAWKAELEEKEANLGQWVESRIHKYFTEIADDLFGGGKLSREERIAMSSAVGDMLDAFVKAMEEKAPELYARGLENQDIPSINWRSKEIPTVLVFKQSDGRSRWVTFSSNAYKDRDREIVSTAALEADVDRADKEGDHGPLRWWHVGKPDPFAKLPGPGADIGRCDYNAMHGRILVESGTFENEQIAEAVKAKAAELQVSIGYFHPRAEPIDGVFHNIRRFERSLLPRGRASNPWTSMLVVQKEGGTMLKEKIQALKALLGGDDELVKAVLDKAEETQKAAEEAGIEFKGDNPPPETPTPVETKAEEVEETAEPEAAEPEEEIENVIGDMTPEEFSGMMAEALQKALEPYTKELKALKAAQAQKDDQAAAMKEAMELQAATVTALKARLDELEGSQPRAANKGYRASQAEETVVKENSPVKGAKPTVDPDFLKFAFGGQ